MGGEHKDLNLETVAREIEKRFGKVWKLQTIATFMTRLQKKGYISVYKVDKYNYYHPEVTQYVYQKQRMEEMKQLFFDGSTMSMVNFIKNM